MEPAMSRAFVREPEGDVVEELPDRPVSLHPNLVTARGLAQINTEIDRLRSALSAGRREDDGLRTAEAERDLRYWLARRATAEIVGPPAGTRDVRFGHKVTIERDDGRRQTYRIVGEDEADPAKGLLSHVSPLAVSLFGKPVGASVTAGNNEAEIVKIE
jgi:transcription elongation GreA/GreB family factor